MERWYWMTSEQHNSVPDDQMQKILGWFDTTFTRIPTALQPGTSQPPHTISGRMAIAHDLGSRIFRLDGTNMGRGISAEILPQGSYIVFNAHKRQGRLLTNLDY